jgi:hypothetical protein
MNTLLSEAVLSTNCFPHAAIVRRKDAMAKARTRDFPLTVPDLQSLAGLFDHPSLIRDQGFTIGNRVYKSIRLDGASVYGKMDEEATAQQMYSFNPNGEELNYDNAPSNGNDEGSGKPMVSLPGAGLDRDRTIVDVDRPPDGLVGYRKFDGIVICKTEIYFLVGIYDRHPGMAVEAMERLADYFRSKNR